MIDWPGNNSGSIGAYPSGKNPYAGTRYIGTMEHRDGYSASCYFCGWQARGGTTQLGSTQAEELVNEHREMHERQGWTTGGTDE